MNEKCMLKISIYNFTLTPYNVMGVYFLFLSFKPYLFQDCKLTSKIQVTMLKLQLLHTVKNGCGTLDVSFCFLILFFWMFGCCSLTINKSRSLINDSLNIMYACILEIMLQALFILQKSSSLY